MTDTARDLRVTSDALLRDLDALVALEEEKRAVPSDDPRLTELAQHIHEIALRVVSRTSRQWDLTEVVAQAPGPAVSIDAVRRSPATILAEWREVEQRRAEAEPGSPQRAELDVLSGRIRDEYREAFDRSSVEGHRIT